MPEAAKSRVVDRILGDRGEDDEKSFTKEWQHTGQAFTLHLEWKDGRQTEGFAWAHYTGYRWVDNGEQEKVILIFGPRAVEIEGHNLGRLVDGIREGKLNSVREMAGARQMQLAHSNPDDEPIVSALRTYPDIDAILKEIKGDDDDQRSHARRLQR